MRTTVSIRDDLHEAARRLAFEQRRTFGDVVNELIERGLAHDPSSTPRRLGTFAGQIEVSDDFDDDLDDFTLALDEPVTP